MNTKQLKKQLILNIPYIILGLLATNLGEAWRIAAGANASEKVQSLVLDGVFATAFSNPLPRMRRNSGTMRNMVLPDGADMRILSHLRILCLQTM